MKLTEGREIGADAATLWAAIMDPEVLRACIPGCESMTGSPEEGFEAVVVQKVGPVKASFRGLIRLSDIDAPHGLTISGEGKGGVAGFAKGSARVTLAPVGEGAATMLGYAVEASVGGKIAQLGSRVIDGFARKMADEFFARLQAAVEEGDAPAAVPERDAPADVKEKGWFRRLVT